MLSEGRRAVISVNSKSTQSPGAQSTVSLHLHQTRNLTSRGRVGKTPVQTKHGALESSQGSFALHSRLLQSLSAEGHFSRGADDSWWG